MGRVSGSNGSGIEFTVISEREFSYATSSDRAARKSRAIDYTIQLKIEDDQLPFHDLTVELDERESDFQAARPRDRKWKVGEVRPRKGLRRRTFRACPKKPMGSLKLVFQIRARDKHGLKIEFTGEEQRTVKNPFIPPTDFEKADRKGDKWIPERHDRFKEFSEKIQGNARFLVVVGPPGVGKSTFLEQWRRWVIHDHVRDKRRPPVVIIARPVPYAGHPPGKEPLPIKIEHEWESLPAFAWRVDKAVLQDLTTYLSILFKIRGYFSRFSKKKLAEKIPLPGEELPGEEQETGKKEEQDYRYSGLFLPSYEGGDRPDEEWERASLVSYLVNPDYYHYLFRQALLNKVIKSQAEAFPSKDGWGESSLPELIFVIDDLDYCSLTVTRMGWLTRYIPRDTIGVKAVIVLRLRLEDLFVQGALEVLKKEMGEYYSFPIAPIIPDGEKAGEEVLRSILGTRLPTSWKECWDDAEVRYLHYLTGGMPQIFEYGLRKWVENRTKKETKAERLRRVSGEEIRTLYEPARDSAGENNGDSQKTKELGLNDLWKSFRDTIEAMNADEAVKKQADLLLREMAADQDSILNRPAEYSFKMTPLREGGLMLMGSIWNRDALVLLQKVGLVETNENGHYRLAIPVLCIAINNSEERVTVKNSRG